MMFRETHMAESGNTHGTACNFPVKLLETNKYFYPPKSLNTDSNTYKHHSDQNSSEDKILG